MRFAISAVAAVSGLLLLGLAMYGQPAVYVRQARLQWDALMDHPPADQGPADQGPADQGPADQGVDPDAAASQQRAAQLQREVVRLEAELAARKALEARPDAISPVELTAPAPHPALPSPPAAPAVIASVPPDRTAPAFVAPANPPPSALPEATPVTGMPPVSNGAISSPVAPPSLPQAAMPPEPRAPTPAASAQPTLPPPPLPTPKDHGPPPASPRVASAPSPAPVPTLTISPDHHEAEPTSSRPDTPKIEPQRAETPKIELPRAEAARPVPPKQVAQRPVPAPPPLPQPTPPRQDADDTQAILARLRQVAPAAAPAPPTEVAPVVMEPAPRPASLPSLPRLIAARMAVTNGQIEAARRLLQEAQLQLVFRSPDALDDEAAATSRAAADVAHALEALSANDVPLSRRYIDVAVNDLSGNGSNAPIQESSRRPSGYAPAYPPR